MPYAMNQQQFEAVLALSSNERSHHFITKVADWQQLWGVNADNVKVAIFPDKQWVFWVMEPDDLAQCLEDLRS